jgi:epoxyqueuosine reductase
MRKPWSRAYEELTEIAQERGFLVGWSPLALPSAYRERYAAWLEAGSHAGMGYLAERWQERMEPSRRFSWAKSAMVLAAPLPLEDPDPPPGGLRVGRVARYAWIGDYHALIEPHLRALEARAAELGLQALGYVDYGPLPERSYAAQAGLGWIGCNGMLLSTQAGSALLLAVLLTSLEVPLPPLHPPRCGRCTRCLATCPTGALRGDGTLDARLCLSYWTVEHRGLIPVELWPALGDWLLGCDLCQEACPWDRKRVLPWPGFEPRPELAHPNLEDFFFLSSRAFARRYAQTAFLRPGRARMARNALIVLANHGETYRSFIEMARRDPHPLVQATALQALAWLNRGSVPAGGPR